MSKPIVRNRKAKPVVVVASKTKRQPLHSVPSMNIIESDNTVAHFNHHPVSAAVRAMLSNPLTPSEKAKRTLDEFYKTPAKAFEKHYDFLAREDFDDVQ